jgi:hypothetical protein
MEADRRDVVERLLARAGRLLAGCSEVIVVDVGERRLLRRGSACSEASANRFGRARRPMVIDLALRRPFTRCAVLASLTAARGASVYSKRSGKPDPGNRETRPGLRVRSVSSRSGEGRLDPEPVSLAMQRRWYRGIIAASEFPVCHRQSLNEGVLGDVLPSLHRVHRHQ